MADGWPRPGACLTLYDHFHGPPAWVGWLNGVGWVLGLWLLLWPVPYLPLVIVVGLMPLLFLGLAARWPETFTAADDRSERFGRRMGRRLIDLSGLWIVPCLAIGGRAFDATLLDPLWAFVVGLGLAIPMTLVCAWLDSRMRGWTMLCNFFFCLSWSWGGVALANTILDRTAGRIVLAEVTWKQDLRREGPEVNLRLPGGDEFNNVDVDQATYDNTLIGRRMCVEVNPGAFGWRVVYLVDCTGPLLDLLKPPAPSAPSPPR